MRFHSPRPRRSWSDRTTQTVCLSLASAEGTGVLFWRRSFVGPPLGPGSRGSHLPYPRRTVLERGGKDGIASTLLRPRLPRRARGRRWGEEGSIAAPGDWTSKKNDPVRRWGEYADCWAQEERATIAWATVLLERPERRPSGVWPSNLKVHVPSHDVYHQSPDDGRRAVSNNASKPVVSAKNLLCVVFYSPLKSAT